MFQKVVRILVLARGSGLTQDNCDGQVPVQSCPVCGVGFFSLHFLDFPFCPILFPFLPPSQMLTPNKYLAPPIQAQCPLLEYLTFDIPEIDNLR